MKIESTERQLEAGERQQAYYAQRLRCEAQTRERECYSMTPAMIKQKKNDTEVDVNTLHYKSHECHLIKDQKSPFV